MNDRQEALCMWDLFKAGRSAEQPVDLLTCRYYLNGADAFRLKLLLPVPEHRRMEHDAMAQMAALSAA